MFLHELNSAKEIFDSIAYEKKISPVIIEKDYWLMHTLWFLQQKGIDFDLKGGTSLSKGYGIIHRFSEDIDIKVATPDNLKVGKNHDEKKHIEARANFFDHFIDDLKSDNLVFVRDHNFDDLKLRNAGIRALYPSQYESIAELKDGILLEIGFDNTTPNLPKNIDSWAFSKAVKFHTLTDNRAINVKCYCPEYTFVEKLQAISTKYRKQQSTGKFDTNFLRHYYDVFRLLENNSVLNFIGTNSYHEYKKTRFRKQDEININDNDAFTIIDKKTRKLYELKYLEKLALYFEEPPSFIDILERINAFSSKL